MSSSTADLRPCQVTQKHLEEGGMIVELYELHARIVTCSINHNDEVNPIYEFPIRSGLLYSTSSSVGRVMTVAAAALGRAKYPTQVSNIHKNPKKRVPTCGGPTRLLYRPLSRKTLVPLCKRSDPKKDHVYQPTDVLTPPILTGKVALPDLKTFVHPSYLDNNDMPIIKEDTVFQHSSQFLTVPQMVKYGLISADEDEQEECADRVTHHTDENPRSDGKDPDFFDLCPVIGVVGRKIIFYDPRAEVTVVPGQVNEFVRKTIEPNPKSKPKKRPQPKKKQVSSETEPSSDDEIVTAKKSKSKPKKITPPKRKREVSSETESSSDDEPYRMESKPLVTRRRVRLFREPPKSDTESSEEENPKKKLDIPKKRKVVPDTSSDEPTKKTTVEEQEIDSVLVTTACAFKEEFYHIDAAAYEEMITATTLSEENEIIEQYNSDCDSDFGGVETLPDKVESTQNSDAMEEVILSPSAEAPIIRTETPPNVEEESDPMEEDEVIPNTLEEPSRTEISSAAMTIEKEEEVIPNTLEEPSLTEISSAAMTIEKEEEEFTVDESIVNSNDDFLCCPFPQLEKLFRGNANKPSAPQTLVHYTRRGSFADSDSEDYVKNANQHCDDIDELGNKLLKVKTSLKNDEHSDLEPIARELFFLSHVTSSVAGCTNAGINAYKNRLHTFVGSGNRLPWGTVSEWIIILERLQETLTCSYTKGTSALPL